jgi:hypothetical protein
VNYVVGRALPLPCAPGANKYSVCQRPKFTRTGKDLSR